MPMWVTIVFTIIGWTGIVGIIVREVISAVKRKKEKVKKLKERAELENLTLTIKDVIKQEIQPLNDRLDSLDVKMDNIKKDLTYTKDGIQAELKHDIRNSCRRCIEQGFRTEDDLQEITSMHDNYEKLGSNGVTNALYDEFQNLPLVPNGHKKESTTKKKTSTKKRLNG